MIKARTMKKLSVLLAVLLTVLNLYGADTLWLKNGERQIFGILSRPEQHSDAFQPVRQPLVIVSHGFNGTHHSGKAYFNALNRLGCQVYTFDYPCVSSRSQSDSNTMNMSILDQISDLKAVVAHFRHQPDIDTTNIVLIGESQGGFVTALTAAQLQEKVRGIVLVYPALCIPDNWNQRYPRMEDIPDTTRLWNVEIGARFFRELKTIDIFKAIPQYKGRVQIIQGSADKIVSIDDSRRAAELYDDAELLIIPKAGHGFRPQEMKKAQRFISGFIEEIIGLSDKKSYAGPGIGQ